MINRVGVIEEKPLKAVYMPLPPSKYLQKPGLTNQDSSKSGR
jgi:hypothetical protein